MTTTLFHSGQVLKRKEIHRSYGGQERGGISTPRKHPYIFIFTGEAGEEFGYKDHWEGEIFHYTGEGQRGDMRFKGGNVSLQDHKENGERVFLFKQRRNGYVEFVNEVAVRGWRFESCKDLSGKFRQGIVFELVALP